MSRLFYNHDGKRCYTTVDKEDLPKLSSFTWFVKQNGYIYTTTKGRKNRTSIYLHRFILSAQSGEEVDHINRNTNDNQKSNLRLCSRSQNNMNRAGVRGVSRFRGAWRVRIKQDRKEKHIGIYKTYKQAVFARKAIEKAMFGKFANV